MSFRNSRSQLFHSRNVKQTLHSLYNRFEGYPKYVYSLRVTCTGKVQAIVEAPFDDTME